MGIVFIAITAASIQPAKAVDTQTIAIIDTAIDSSKNANVIYEVCFTLKTCPNKTSFQEGVGAANVADWKVKGIDHGYNISQAAVIANPNVKIVFIRISDMNVYPTFTAIHNDGTSLDRAIDWVSKNSEKFNIKAVSISQSRINFAAGTCPSDSVFEKSVAVLNSVSVPTFVATGNDAKTNQVGFPACVTGVVGVGALKPTVNKRPYLSTYYTALANYTNVGPGLDVVARGDADVKAYGGWDITITGTSVATPMAAAIAVGKYAGPTWDSYFAGLTKSANYPYISN